jgi:sugar phosphate permease
VLTIPIGLVGPWQLLCVALVPLMMLGAPAFSAVVHAFSQRVPEAARGTAMGLHHTFVTLGAAAAGPVAGAVIDGWGTRWSFAVTGLVGLLLVILAVPLWRRTPPPAEPVVGSAEQAATCAA